MKLRAQRAGLTEHAEWTEKLENCRTLMNLDPRFPFPHDAFLRYIKQLSLKEKQALALVLDFHFVKRDTRKWPEMLFWKTLRTTLLHSQRDLITQRRFFLSLLKLCPELMEALQMEWDELIMIRREHIQRYGYWSYYWALHFHHGRAEHQERWRQELEKLRNDCDNSGCELAAGVTPSTASKNATVEQKGTRMPEGGEIPSRKLERLELKCGNEVALRMRLELELAQQEKKLRQSEQELSNTLSLLGQRNEQLEHVQFKHKEQKELQRRKELQLRQERHHWLQERQALLATIREANSHHKALERQLEAKDEELSFMVREQARHKQTIDHYRRKLHDQPTLLEQLVRTLYEDIERMNGKLLYPSTSEAAASSEEAIQLRRRMRKALDLADALSGYEIHPDDQTLEQTETHKQDAKLSNEEIDSDDSDPAIERFTPLQSSKQSQPDSDAPEPLQGTFFRRDHGGYILLETGSCFNITESMVHQLALQHEAEVLCTPSDRASQRQHYELQLLFQGDDICSPIRQFDGYVQSDEGEGWYCVDMNDDRNRFPIHRRDVEIKRPLHGDPCSFNVAEDGRWARLARLYRLESQAAEIAVGKDKHTSLQAGRSGKEVTRANASAAADRKSRAPFLAGCTIAIIGGMRKWFEHVVLETGATLVHDTGERPERIAAELSRSQALFMLLSATSHRATWDGVEAAKSNGIPHFTIQGSKSNLRLQLWENRETIRSANR
ncbi:hypothetical protein [Paenibacillus chungangensis]|uniref:DUF2325 domain-containing protein n=1 Tax=Paenibacillus chungangensis TaxID=696535 RepID=A0ABW3HM56_9BACL